MTAPFDDKLHEECGVLARHDDAPALTREHALQHRARKRPASSRLTACSSPPSAVGLVGDVFGNDSHMANSGSQHHQPCALLDDGSVAQCNRCSPI
jgi:hypothetical protein